MTILAQSLLALVGSHLVALLLLSVWHNVINIKCELFHFLNKTLGRLESGNIVRVNNQGSVF